MGSSGGGPGNPMYLSQGGQPIPGLPIAGQGAPNDDPHKFGTYQSFLPDMPAPGSGARMPTATGLTSDMFQYKGPQGQNPEADALRQQLAAALAAKGGGGGGAAAPAAASGGNGQFGAARGGAASSIWGYDNSGTALGPNGAPLNYFDWTNGSFTPGGLTAGG